MKAKFYLSLMLLLLATITVQSARPEEQKQNSMHVHAKREACEPNNGMCVDPWFDCEFGGIWCPWYECPLGTQCCCPRISK